MSTSKSGIGEQRGLLSLEFRLLRNALLLSCCVVLSVGTEEVVEVSE